MLDNNNNNHKRFVIAHKETEEYIGQIDIYKIDWKNRTAELGIVIGFNDYLNKGYGSEAIKLSQEFVFDQMNLNRLQLDVSDFNERAYRCYLKCGFKEEGRLRHRYYNNGSYVDSIIMGILKEEYQEMKDRL